MTATLSIGIISSYFTKYYHTATNIITTALPLAITIFAPITQFLIDIYGWRGAMLLLAGLNLHVIVAATILKPTNITELDGKSYQCLEEPKKKQHLEDTICDTITACVKDIFNISLFQNGSFIIILIVSVFSDYAYNGWVVFLVSILQGKGLVASEAAIVASVSGTGALIIRIIMIIIQGKMSVRVLLYVGSILVMVSYLSMYFVTSFLVLLVGAFLLGAGLGITGTLVYVAANAIVGEKEAMTAVAWINLMLGIGYIVSGCITGELLQTLHSPVRASFFIFILIWDVALSRKGASPDFSK